MLLKTHCLSNHWIELQNLSLTDTCRDIKMPRVAAYKTPPCCLFICMIISSCPKEQQQDIWCNTMAGSVPCGAQHLPLGKLSMLHHSVCACRQPLPFPPSSSPSALGSPYLSHGFTLLKNELSQGIPSAHFGLFGDWMICSGAVSPSMLDTTAVRSPRTCSCSLGVKNACIKCGRS